MGCAGEENTVTGCAVGGGTGSSMGCAWSPIRALSDRR